MPSTPIASRAVAPIVVAALLSGCYRYVPTQAAPPLAGSEVRLYLTPQGMVELESRLGPQTATVVGRVGDVTERDVTLVVSETRKSFGGAPVRWVGQQVTVPAAAIARTERRTLDRRRTLLTGAGVLLAALAGLVVLRATGGAGSGDDPGGGGPGPVP